MFDPTIYENIKVVIEGEVYEHDLNGEILIINRKDIVDLATMSRYYSITFQQLNISPVYRATIKLEASSNDLYGEILDKTEQNGCNLLLTIHAPIQNISTVPPLLQEKLASLWGKRPSIQQQFYFEWNEKNAQQQYFARIFLNFDRKINESHISDFPEIITLLIKSLIVVEEINRDTP